MVPRRARGLACDPEGIVPLDGRVLLFHSADIGESGTDGETLAELVQLRGWTDGVNFHIAIVEIAGVAGQLELGGGAFHEVAEANALHASAYQVPLRGSGHEFIINLMSGRSADSWHRLRQN